MVMGTNEPTIRPVRMTEKCDHDHQDDHQRLVNIHHGAANGGLYKVRLKRCEVQHIANRQLVLEVPHLRRQPLAKIHRIDTRE